MATKMPVYIEKEKSHEREVAVRQQYPPIILEKWAICWKKSSLVCK